MRDSTNLLALPYVFSQRGLLTAGKFADEAKLRGTPSMRLATMEGLHRVGLLVPLLRVSRDGRGISQLARGGRTADATHVGELHHTATWDLLRLQAAGRLHDPASEGFLAKRWRPRSVAGVEYRPSQYLYSPWQLLGVGVIDQALSHLVWSQGPPGKRHVTGIRVNDFWINHARFLAGQARNDALVLSALEPLYYPQIVRSLSLDTVEAFDLYDEWRRRERPTKVQRWLDLPAAYFRDRGSQILHRADRIDPVKDWLPLIREADPRRWKQLRGDGLLALEGRIAAELHLLYYERLVKARRAAPLPKPRGRWQGEFETRLKPRGQLDSTLTTFGLSPHPSLVLVVEGATELMILPRIMRLVGIRTDEDFISIQDREGVRNDISSLLAYAIAPRVRHEEDAGYLRLDRPLARVLVVSDPEGPMATAQDRERRRGIWVERLERTLPAEVLTPSVRESLDELVSVEVWNSHDESFEFAHFTDLQIARAIDSVDRRTRRLGLKPLREQVARCRRHRAGLGSVMGHSKKTDLAEALWPVLQRKVERAQYNGTADRIPAIRILDLATDLAHKTPRSGVVIPLDPAV